MIRSVRQTAPVTVAARNGRCYEAASVSEREGTFEANFRDRTLGQGNKNVCGASDWCGSGARSQLGGRYSKGMARTFGNVTVFGS